MKIYLVLLIMNSSIVMSNELLNKEKAVGCTISAFSSKKAPCLSKKTKPHNVENKKKGTDSTPHDAKEQLSIIVYKYQSKHGHKENNTKEQLMTIKKAFVKEQVKKTKPFKKIKKTTKKKKTIKKKKHHKVKILKKSLKSRKKVIKKIKLPLVGHLPWVDIVADKHIDIYQLAQLYYGDRKKYLLIYAANQNIIGANYKIKNGSSLKIPMTADFKEQPMFLNTD